jgi:hypothetical protein
MTFNDWMVAAGFDPETTSDKQKLILQAAWRAEQAGDQEPVDREAAANAGRQTVAAGRVKEDPAESIDSHMDKVRRENTRRRKITALVAEAADEQPSRVDEFEALGRKAIESKWTEQDTELALLRGMRPTSPLVAGGRGSGGQLSGKVLEAALAQATGLSAIEKHYDERTLEAAHKQFRGALGLQQLLGICAQANGYRSSAPVKADLKNAMRYAFDGGLQANSGISTISISTTLSNVANKFVREAFMGVEAAWQEISAERSVSDFKAITSFSLSGDMEYVELAPGGNIEHGTIGETTYSNQAKTYAKMLGIDRRDWINDDAGALKTVNKRLGRGGALKLNKVFWTAFMDNTSFFSSGNANVSTGAGSALGLAGLGTAESTFRILKDPDSNLMGVKPAILLVPTALRATAWNLMNSTTTVSTTTANTPLPDGNPWAGMFKVVDSAYLQDTTITGNSTAAWYLLADPADVPVIEVAFLNGNRMPTIESADADFNMLGVQFRGYWDFGVAKQEYRGGVRSAGS